MRQLESSQCWTGQPFENRLDLANNWACLLVAAEEAIRLLKAVKDDTCFTRCAYQSNVIKKRKRKRGKKSKRKREKIYNPLSLLVAQYEGDRHNDERIKGRN